jgi:hypothetical protein
MPTAPNSVAFSANASAGDGTNLEFEKSRSIAIRRASSAYTHLDKARQDFSLGKAFCQHQRLKVDLMEELEEMNRQASKQIRVETFPERTAAEYIMRQRQFSSKRMPFGHAEITLWNQLAWSSPTIFHMHYTALQRILKQFK